MPSRGVVARIEIVESRYFVVIVSTVSDRIFSSNTVCIKGDRTYRESHTLSVGFDLLIICYSID